MIVIEINVDNIEVIEVEGKMIRHHQYDRHAAQAVNKWITYRIHFKSRVEGALFVSIKQSIALRQAID